MSAIASALRERWLEASCAAIIAVNLGLIAAFPHRSAIPLHLIWLAIALACAMRGWEHRPTRGVTVLACALAGVLLWRLGSAHDIDAEELVEAPLTAAVFLAMAWQVRRRQDAAERAHHRAGTEQALREAQQAFAVQACHDVRNPITVARGYAELITRYCDDPDVREDSQTVISELDRAMTIGTRMHEFAAEPEAPATA